MNSQALLITSLVTGAIIGVLSGTPLLNLANCLFCMWIWAASIFGVWFYRRNAGDAPVSTAQGAGIGALSALFGALVSTILAAFFALIFGDVMYTALIDLIGNLAAQSADPEVATMALEVQRELEAALAAGQTGPSLISMLFNLIFNMITYPIAGAIGGAIGAALFGKPRTPAPSYS